MEHNDIISVYIKDMARYPILTREEEAELAKKAKAGDKEARARVVNSSLRFVMKVAKQYRGMGLPLEDLVSEGNVGLLMAIDRFDANKGNRFISYAVWWIKAMIRKALSDLNRENAIQVSLPDDEVLEDDGHGNNDSESMGSNAKAALIGEASVTDDAIEEGVKNAVASELRLLPAKEAHVIKLRYGLNNASQWMSLKEVGEKMHMSKEAIRLIEKRAFERLRSKNSLKAWVA